MKLHRSRTAKAVSLAVGAAMMFSLSVAPAANAQTVAELQAQIQNLLSLIASLQTQLGSIQGGGGGVGTGVCPFTWTRNLTTGSTGDDVRALQRFLNSDSATQVSTSGAGSPGNETSTFGPATKAAVMKFQNKYASEVLAPVGLTAGTGYFGSSSRAKANMLCASAPTPTPPAPPVTPGTPPAATGTGLQVSKPSQPSDSLAPKSAARVPFTNFTVTAGLDGAVVLNSVTVERTGLSVDSNFSQVLLMDENGAQLGLEKTLNSNHQATVGEAVTVNAGQSRTFTVAGNMAATVSAGEIASLDIVALNTSAAVTGSLPIRGASHTMNNNLAVGTVTVTALPYSGSSNQEIGTTALVFGAFRVTAGSQEKVRLHSIRWNQTGSAGKDDLSNFVTVVEGVEYPATVSSDGKYYTSVFPGGILIDKGFSKEIRAKGNIIGGSGRTVIVDIYRKTDLDVRGDLYGYGITPPAGSATGTATNNVFTAGTPWLDGATWTIAGGSLSVQKATSVNAQNIAENAPDQILGGFEVEAKGEPVTVSSIVFWFQVTGTGNTGDLTNITLVDPNGSVVAGPVDAASDKATFSSSVTFPVGKGIYSVKGKMGTDAANNDTIIASSTPGTDWTTVTGDVTGNSITPTPSTSVTSNTMTLKAATMTVSVSSVPIAQTIIAGAPFTFSNYQLDATASGDDVKFTSLALAYDAASGTPSNLSGCSLWDGTTELTSGSNRVNPTAVSSSTTFTLDNDLTVMRGTVKTLGLQCSTSATTTGGLVAWGLDSGQTITVSGVDSGVSFNATLTDSTGQYMTMNTGGSLTVTDDSTAGYRLVSPGQDVELLRVKFTATNEAIDLRRVAFELANTASNTPIDLVGNMLTLWSGTTQVGTAQFTANGDTATSTLLNGSTFRIPSGSSMTLVAKGVVNSITSSGPLTASGDLLKVVYDGNSVGLANGTYGVGVSSGTNISGSTTDVPASHAGVRVVQAYPTLAKIDLSASDKVLANGSNKRLYRFSVTASNDDVYLYKFTVSVGTTSSTQATTSVYGLYSYTDSAFSSVDSQINTDGIFNYANAINASTADITLAANGSQNPGTVDIYPLNSSSATTTFKVPSGQTRYFELTGTIKQVETGTGSETLTYEVEGDAAHIVGASTEMVNALKVDNDTNDDFIWSPNSTSTSNTFGDLDWINGFQVSGLPQNGMPTETLTSVN